MPTDMPESTPAPEAVPEPGTWACFRCNESFAEDDDRKIIYHHYSWCEDCHDVTFFTCDNCLLMYNRADAHDEDGEILCKACYNARYTQCDACAESVPVDEVCTGLNDQSYCSDCYDERYTSCAGCARVIDRDTVHQRHEEFCPQCIDPYITLASTTYEHNPSQRKVGFELEFITSETPELEEWGKLKDDGSVCPDDDDGDGSCGYEFASHIASGDTLLNVIDAVCAGIRDTGATVNTSCGFHVHLDMRGTTPEERRNIARWWRVFEPVFFGMMSESRQNNDFCGSVRNSEDCNRYRTLNVTAFSKHGTFEVRLHQGTTDSRRVRDWTIFLLHFFDTFQHLPCEEERSKIIDAMTHRERLITLFQLCPMPLSIRRYILRQTRLFHSKLLMANAA